MEQFLYRLEPTRVAMLTEGPTEREARIVGEHFAYLQQLLAAGTLLMAGRTTNNDVRAELFPYRIALWSPNGH